MIALFFYKSPRTTAADWEQAGYRAAWLAIAQIPLVTLLSCRRLTVIAVLTGTTSSVSLNFFHRWISRGFFMIATIHMFYEMRYYASFDFLQSQLKTDPITKNGLRSFCLLAWIVVVSSVRPIRHYLFELFFVNHIASVIAFLVILMRHTPSYSHVYLWTSIGFICVDVAMRWGLLLLNNISTRGLKYRANIESIPDSDLLRITIPINGSVRLFRWSPGQFAYLSFPTYGPFMSHPFSIMSVQEDRALEFIVKKKTGITHWLHRSTKRASSADMSTSSPSYSTKRESDSYSADAEIQLPTTMESISGVRIPVLIDGPYGGNPRDLRQFSTLLSICAGSGATYGLAVARGLLLAAAKTTSGATRNVELAWCIKRYADMLAFKKAIQELVDAKDSCNNDISLSINVYISDISSIPDDDEEFNSPNKLPSCVTVIPRRPVIRHIIADAMTTSSVFGELAVTVCGGSRLAADVKNSVSILLDARAAHTGSNGTAQGCYVHVEQFEG